MAPSLPQTSMATTIEIAQSARMRLIMDVATDIGLVPQGLILRGGYIAKTRLSLSDDETLRGATTGWTLKVRAR